MRRLGVLGVAIVLGASACGGGPDPSAQELGGPAAADLERTWEVTLEVTEVQPAAIELDEVERSRVYAFERGSCPTEVEVAGEQGGPPPVPAEDVHVETAPEGCIGSATVEVAGGTVSGLPFVQVGPTRFRMAYEARVACLDAAGQPVGDLAQAHELVWELDAADAPEELTGELVRTIRTQPGCAPPAGQETGTVERLRATPLPADGGEG
jgi:hypothetical protein